MSYLSAVVSALESASAGWDVPLVVAENLFEGRLREDDDRQVALVTYTGGTAEYVSGGHDLPALEYPRFTAFCRDKKYADADTLAEAVYAAINRMPRLDAGGGKIIIDMNTTRSPAPLRRDTKQRSVWSSDFEVTVNNRG